MSPQEKYASKIAKLLAKAESTSSSEEAEALIAKAQELMVQYSIDEMMIDSARGVETDVIEQIKIIFTGSYRSELMDLAWAVCRVNNCKGCQWEVKDYSAEFKTVAYADKAGGRQRFPKQLILEVTGFRSDLRHVSLLETSLRLQATTAMTSWWKEHKNEWTLYSYAHQTAVRKNFLVGFTASVRTKLNAAYKAGKRESIRIEAERQNVSETEVGDSVALVLRSREDRVEEWYDSHYGKLRAGRARHTSLSSRGAYNAGNAAGARADIGQTRLGSRKGLNK